MTIKKHPLLKKLKIDNGQISSSQVLTQLLSSKVLSEDALRSAVQSIANQNKQEVESEEIKSLNIQQPQYRTRHIALKFYYNGADFSGLAQNIGQDNDNSVEKQLFFALTKTKLIESRQTCGYSRCGRTDRGVSAVGQVVAFQLKSAIPDHATLDPQGTCSIANQDLPNNEHSKLNCWVYPKTKRTIDKTKERISKEIAEYSYAKILNNLLPPAIRILGWAPVSDEFSARFSANARTYRYFFCKRQMDVSKITQGLKLMVGKHDFRNFCKMDVEKVYNFERLIYDTDVVEVGDKICYLLIHGQAFLWHQIRCIAHVLFMIGRGLEEPSIVTELFDIKKCPGKPAYQIAEDKPLVLQNCEYPSLQIGYSAQNLWTVSCQLEQQWEDLILAATRIRNCIDSFKILAVNKQELLAFLSAKVTERHKKQERMGTRVQDVKVSLDDLVQEDDSSTFITWKQVLPWLLKLSLVPEPVALNHHIHIPLLKRSKGTTYEQKLEALQKNDKKRKKYEETVVKKRKTTEEDAKFYQYMAKQGGTGV
jgi:tRNA pseudouridine38/39 synthase